jgi:hypothetical protein
MRKPRCAAMLGHCGCNDDTAHNDRIRQLHHNGPREAEKRATRNNQQATPAISGDVQPIGMTVGPERTSVSAFGGKADIVE